MAAKDLLQFLLFSGALGAGFDWLSPRSEWEKRHSSPGAGEQEGQHHNENWKGPGSYMTWSDSGSVAPSVQPSIPYSHPSVQPSGPPAVSSAVQPSVSSSRQISQPPVSPSKQPPTSPSKQPPISSPSRPSVQPSTQPGSPSQPIPSSYNPPSGLSSQSLQPPVSAFSGSGSPQQSGSKPANSQSIPGMPGYGGGACTTTCATACTGPTATLGCGVVIGTTTSLPAATATVNKFLGVPFAQSPPERFSPPQKPGTCNVNATAWKPACIQQFVGTEVVRDFTMNIFNNPAPEESEDCLYLNVYTPGSPAPPGGRAVMFWIYGGALQFGGAGQPFYDGSWFASYEDVIVVTTNYRTNVFGFATSPEIPIDQQNLGFLDQRFALDWVQQNIAAFGGSPDKVTIFGESAGSWSVDALLTSYPANSKPPFRAAILESGTVSYPSAKRTSTVPQWNQLASMLGCPGKYGSNLTCLRQASASAIKNIIETNSLEFNPRGDNVTLMENAMQQRLSGNIAQIPVLVGSNSQEGRVFTVGQTNSSAFLSTTIGNNPAAIKALEALYPPYRASTGAEAYEQLSEIVTEFVFQCGAALLANATADLGIPSWRYYFNASFANTQPFPQLGVYHSSEIPIVFSTYPRTNVTTQEYALSRAMRGMWATFAKNPAGGPGWNPVDTGIEDEVLVGGTSEAEGGILMAENGTATRGTVNAGVLGNRGDSLGSGVTVIDSQEIDYRCGVYISTYMENAVAG